ncbi:MAG TPA: MBL fold metallo-hydrolase [Steroidobacteraceae bacterium]
MTAIHNDAPSWTRRGLLQAAMGTIGAVSVAARAQAPSAAAGIPGGAAPATVIHSELRQLTPTVYAFLQREAPGQSNFSISNFGLIIGPASLLAIDAGGGPQHARNFIAAASRFGKPFNRVVITHEHPDHIVGLTQFPAGIEIVSQEATRAQMVKMGTPRTPAYWATNPAWARPGDVNKVILPNVTFKDRLTLYYGDMEVDVYWPGRAHTSGDALILLPRERVLFMGDVAFFGVTPLNGSGFIQDWIKVCDAVLADERVATIVPGHGPIGTKSDLRDMRGYLSLILQTAQHGLQAGISPGRAAAELDLGKYATWTDADRIATNMARVYEELRGTVGVDMNREGAAQAVAEYERLKARR